ncbi:TPA: hypothetical protein IAA87_04650 [Candidatus Avigastranaerophilus faecigallinarum]|nr:hypothetical protein [Candidatus Avigastranaerophilus faecigallinarum]
MKKFFLFLLLIITPIFFSEANASLKVTPTILELNANETKSNYITASFDVQGDKDETIRFKIYPSYFKISPQGTMDVIEENTEEKANLIKNVRFVPNEFTLQNGNKQKVRLTITNLKNIPDGESRMVLFLEDVAAKELILPSGMKDVTTKLIVKTRVGIPIYLDKGKFIKCANIEKIDLKKQNKELQIDLKLTSSGNSKVRYNGKAQIIKGEELISEHKIKNHVIGSNNHITTTEKIPLDSIKTNGEYTLRLVIQYTNEKGHLKSLIEENQFTVDNLSDTNI